MEKAQAFWGASYYICFGTDKHVWLKRVGHKRLFSLLGEHCSKPWRGGRGAGTVFGWHVLPLARQTIQRCLLLWCFFFFVRIMALLDCRRCWGLPTGEMRLGPEEKRGKTIGDPGRGDTDSGMAFGMASSPNTKLLNTRPLERGGATQGGSHGRLFI